VVQHVLVEFALGFALEHHHLEEGEEVDSQLDHEVHLELVDGVDRPAGVLLVDLSARPAAPRHAGEPVLLPEQRIGEDCDCSVEDAVKAEFEHKAGLVHALLALVL